MLLFLDRINYIFHIPERLYVNIGPLIYDYIYSQMPVISALRCCYSICEFDIQLTYQPFYHLICFISSSPEQNTERRINKGKSGLKIFLYHYKGIETADRMSYN